MPVNFKILSLLCATALTFASCDKECDEPAPMPSGGGNAVTTPPTYSFTDGSGNSTVSFNGQAQRLEMLSEMTALMKSTNTSGTSIDGQALRDMYANNGITWIDGPALGMTGSSKQLKSKTAAAPSGIADPAIQAQFELLMDEMTALSATTQSGSPNGGQGQGGVVVSTTDPSKMYLQNENGMEYTQLIEKGLMGAVFYNQIVQNYLGNAELNVDNTTPVDPAGGKYYTEMEHAWDEAYGYFTTATDYAPGGNGTNRFWGNYANGRETLMGSATKIATAFRRGRAAIAVNNIAVRDAQRVILRDELQKVVAGTAIHYLNGSVADFGDDALRNHQLSEAIAFIGGLPYGYQSIADQSQVAQWLIAIGDDLYNVTVADLLAVRDEIAALADLESIKEQL